MRIIVACLAVIAVCSCKPCGSVKEKSIDAVTERPIDPTGRQLQASLIISMSYGALDVVRGPLSFDDFYREYAGTMLRNGECLDKKSEEGLPETAMFPTVDDPNRVLPMGEGWLAFRDLLDPEDEFYYYRTDIRSWEDMRGREGYVLIRGWRIMRDFCVAMN